MGARRVALIGQFTGVTGPLVGPAHNLEQLTGRMRVEFRLTLVSGSGSITVVAEDSVDGTQWSAFQSTGAQSSTTVIRALQQSTVEPAIGGVFHRVNISAITGGTWDVEVRICAEGI